MFKLIFFLIAPVSLAYMGRPVINAWLNHPMGMGLVTGGLHLVMVVAVVAFALGTASLMSLVIAIPVMTRRVF